MKITLRVSHRRNDLNTEATYNPGLELAPQYKGLYGKQSIESKRGEIRAAARRQMQQAQAKKPAAPVAGAAVMPPAPPPTPTFLEESASGRQLEMAGGLLPGAATGLSALLDANLQGSGAVVSAAEEFDFEYLLAGIKPEFADMAAGFETCVGMFLVLMMLCL